ncbi:hypothetical protein [Roseomonas fluvialis]|jgi:hypothetical protein|uniref:Lipoprotein n=1 Tax=Roseomonas fluvialis TaxID=1750527 RepID=A0ABN6PAL3_9PROT|nr:hypothetical protein [Roseomonas fluvialis]BDG74681.1 hypothetical protein Rmf_46100 [Roseomonas fluvialis]
MTFPLLRAGAAILLIGGLAACDVTDRQAGDPPGSAAGRATDRAMGTNMSGAYPSQRDGTAVNPRGTALERAVDPAGTPVRRNPSAPNL